MQKIRISWKGKCPRHPRFNGRAGRGAVRGCCPVCDALVSVEEAAIVLSARCHLAAERIERIERSRMLRAERIQ